jgi:hypothetical protein
MRAKLGVLFLLLFGASLYGAGGVGPDFLRISPPAKTASLSGAFTASAKDINSILFNPAGLGFIKKPIVSLTHYASFADTNYEYLAAAFPMKKGVGGVALLVDYTLDFMEIDEYGNEAGNVENYDVMLVGSYSYPLYDWLKLGAILLQQIIRIRQNGWVCRCGCNHENRVKS